MYWGDKKGARINPHIFFQYKFALSLSNAHKGYIELPVWHFSQQSQVHLPLAKHDYLLHRADQNYKLVMIVQQYNITIQKYYHIDYQQWLYLGHL